MRIVDRGLELADLLEAAQVSLHPPDQMVGLLERRPAGQRGADRQHGLLIAGEITPLIDLLDKEPQRAPQSLIHDGLYGLFPDRLAYELVVFLDQKRIIGRQHPFLFRVRILYFLGQEEDRNAKRQEQEATNRLAPTTHKRDLPAIITGEPDGETPPETGQLSRLPFPFLQPETLDQRRDQEKGNRQRDRQVNDNHGREILQVQPDLLIEKEDDHQRANRGQRRRQDRKEGLPVVPVADMVGHHDRIINHETQRNGDTRQRIKLDLQPQQVIENHGDTKIHRQADHDQEQIAGLPGNAPHEQQQDQDREARPQVDCIQLLLDIFRRVVTDVHLITGRQALP